MKNAGCFAPSVFYRQSASIWLRGVNAGRRFADVVAVPEALGGTDKDGALYYERAGAKDRAGKWLLML
jgi:hypothetical protein